jgi:hypothetical protein
LRARWEPEVGTDTERWSKATLDAVMSTATAASAAPQQTVDFFRTHPVDFFMTPPAEFRTAVVRRTRANL